MTGTPTHPKPSHSFRHYLGRRWEAARVPIVVLGDAMLDVYVYGSVDRISAEAPVPVIRQERSRDSLGGAANAAANIVSMGGRAHLICSAGVDTEARRLAALLDDAGVTFDIVPIDGRCTTVKTRFTAGQHQLLRLDREDGSAISPGAEEAVVRALAKAVDRARLLVVSDYDKGLLTTGVLEQAIALARRRGLPVLVDPKRRDFSAYRGASLLKPNRAELEAATGLPTRSDEDTARAAGRAADSAGADILVTRGEAGMTLVASGGSTVHMPTHAREVFDVSGAGDTVMAALAVGMAAGRPIEEAMAFANLAGGIAVSKRGTAVVSEAELEAERALIAEDLPQASGELASVDEAVRLRELWRSQGLVVGFTNGCFDLLHPGHVALLAAAAKSCDRLIVGLNSDASVRRLKGPDRPVQTVEARAAVLGAIEHVNLVVVFDQDTPLDLIERLLPEVLIKGADYKPDEIVGHVAVTAAGGRVLTVELVSNQSTTGLIRQSRTGASR